MAKLKNKYFGELKGKLGDVVFRQKGKINYVSQVPRNYKTPLSPDYYDRINTFTLSTKFASVVYSIYEMKTIWFNNAPNHHSLFNILVSKIYSVARYPDLRLKIKITPERGFSVKLKMLNLNENNIEFNFEPIGVNSGLNLSEHTKVKLISVLWLFDPYDKTIPEFDFIKVASDISNLSLTDNLVFNIGFYPSQSSLLSIYKKCRIYSTIVTMNDDLVINNYSNTVSIEQALR